MQQVRQASPRFIFELLDNAGFGPLTTITFSQMECAHLPLTLTTTELIELTNLLTGWNEKANQEGRAVTERFICDLCPSPEGSHEGLLTVLTLRQTQYSQQALPMIFTSAEVGEFRRMLQEWRRILSEYQGPTDDVSLQALDLAMQLPVETDP
jgi:hypothetical protein